MRKLFIVIVSVLVSFGLASAASVHLKGGRNAEPVFVDTGLTLVATGELSGLGNGDVVVSMSAVAEVYSTCTNYGGNQAPGQNPADITVAGSVAIPQEEVKNGNTPFAVETFPPFPIIIEGAPDCPNPNWTETIEDLLFKSVEITVEQPEGNLVLTVSCTIDPPSSDGLVPKNTVSCSQN